MRIFRIGLTLAALGFGGAAFAQASATPNANLPGGGATVPPVSTGNPVGGIATPPPSAVPLGQGNLPPTSTNNLGGANNVSTTPGMGTSTTGPFQSTTSNVGTSTLAAPTTGLNEPGLNEPGNPTFGAPAVGTRAGLPSTQTPGTPSNLGVPLSNPLQQPVPGTSGPGNAGPGTVGGLSTSPTP
jgi:hypothetical protein